MQRVVVSLLALVPLAAACSRAPQAAPPPLEVGTVRVTERDVPIVSEWVTTLDGSIRLRVPAGTANNQQFRVRGRGLPKDKSGSRGDLFVIEGLDKPIPMGLIAAAGKSAEDLAMFNARFEDMHRGGWDPEARLDAQDRDGVHGEILYPTVGMMLCNHPDFDYKTACFDAYNRWLQSYCEAAPDRLFGQAQTAMRSVEEGIADLRRAKEMGFVGLMMPGDPAVDRALEELRFHTKWVRLLGSYRQARPRSI